MSKRYAFPRGTWAEDSQSVSARTGSSGCWSECTVRCVGVAWAQCACSKKKKTGGEAWAGEWIRLKNERQCSLHGFSLLFPFASVNKPRGSVHRKTGTTGNRSNYTTCRSFTVQAPRLYILHPFSEQTLTLVFFISDPLLTTFTTSRHGTTRVRPTSSPNILYRFASHSTRPFKTLII